MQPNVGICFRLISNILTYASGGDVCLGLEICSQFSVYPASNLQVFVLLAQNLSTVCQPPFSPNTQTVTIRKGDSKKPGILATEPGSSYQNFISITYHYK